MKYTLILLLLIAIEGRAEKQNKEQYHVVTNFNITVLKVDSIGSLIIKIHKDKSALQNKQLIYIIDNFRLPIKSYVLSFSNKVGLIKGIRLYFDNAKETSNALRKQEPIHSIYIEFNTPVLSYQAAGMLKASHGDWLPAELSYYGQQIIKFLETK
jgi:hypothetical protein